jgi:hypothetical protein
VPLPTAATAETVNVVTVSVVGLGPGVIDTLGCGYGATAADVDAMDRCRRRRSQSLARPRPQPRSTPATWSAFGIAFLIRFHRAHDQRTGRGREGHGNAVSLRALRRSSAAAPLR